MSDENTKADGATTGVASALSAGLAGEQGQYVAEECCIPKFGSCCCNCLYHLQDNYHCTTAPELRTEKGGCMCGEQKGWICAPPEFEGTAHSGWTEHGMCEMHELKAANV
jgi:hypothetical protein